MFRDFGLEYPVDDPDDDDDEDVDEDDEDDEDEESDEEETETWQVSEIEAIPLKAGRFLTSPTEPA